MSSSSEGTLISDSFFPILSGNVFDEDALKDFDLSVIREGFDSLCENETDLIACVGLVSIGRIGNRNLPLDL
jgi:hypothetical protein